MNTYERIYSVLSENAKDTKNLRKEIARLTAKGRENVAKRPGVALDIYDRVEALQKQLKGDGGTQSLKAGTEIKMNAYDRIFETLVGEEMTPEQKERFAAGQRIFGKIKQFKPGAKKHRPKAASEKKP